MYYILYDLKTLKVVHKDIKPLKPQNMNFYGIAEYNGELPKGDFLTVANVHKEIETWKEKEIVAKLDKDGQPIFNEQGEPILEEVEVEKSKTHIVCDLVAHFYPKVELTEEQKLEREKQRLRNLREKECFALVNRGELWYKRLTEEQKAELDVWYQAWLDVTQTLEIPVKPEWLK